MEYTPKGCGFESRWRHDKFFSDFCSSATLTTHQNTYVLPTKDDPWVGKQALPIFGWVPNATGASSLSTAISLKSVDGLKLGCTIIRAAVLLWTPDSIVGSQTPSWILMLLGVNLKKKF